MALEKNYEELVVTGVTLEQGEVLRQKLVDKFTAHTWFFLYQNGDITVCNDFCGRVNSKLLDEIIVYAQNELDTMCSRHEAKCEEVLCADEDIEEVTDVNALPAQSF